MTADPDVQAEADRIVRARGGDQAAALKTGEKAALRTLVARAVNEGWDQATLASRIKQAVGLDPRLVTAVESHRKALIAQGMAPGKAAKAAKAYATRLRTYRANLLARQERAMAVGDAQRKVWADRQVAKVYSRWAVRVFRTAKDERTCPVCRPMNGRRASLRHGSVYKGTPHHGPPLHVGCRCTEQILDEGLVKTDPELWGPDDAELADITKRLIRRQPRVRTGAGMLRYGLPMYALITGQPQAANVSAPPRLIPQAQRDLDRLSQDPRPGVRAFAKGLSDVLDRYPALNAHVGRVIEADEVAFDMKGDVAFVARLNPSTGLNVVVVSDRMLHEDLEHLKTRMTEPDYDPDDPTEVDIHHAVESGVAPEDVSIEDFAYAVGVHESGHLAHKHFVAVNLGIFSGAVVDADMAAGKGVKDLPSITRYANASDAEAVAEWWAADFLGYEYEGPEPVPPDFADRFEAALAQDVTWLSGAVGYSLKKDAKDDASPKRIAERGFARSVVWAWTVRQARRRKNGVSKRAQPRVRTRAGMKRYGLPLLAPIKARNDYPGLDDTAREGLDRLLKDSRPAVRAFAEGVQDVLDAYPALGVHVGWVLEADDEGEDGELQVAWVQRVGRHHPKQRVLVVDRLLRRSFGRFVDRLEQNGSEEEGKAGVAFRVNTSEPDLQRYAYAIGIHEMGHIAHAHYLAAGMRYAKPERVMNHEQQGLGVDDLREVSTYAAENAMERFAEWFVSHVLMMGDANDRFAPKFESAMAQKIVFDDDMFVAVRKSSRQQPHDDFAGSVVEAFALGRGEPIRPIGSGEDGDMRTGELRKVRYVATPEGEDWFGIPIGSPIVGRGGRVARSILRKVPAKRFLAAFDNAFGGSPFRRHVTWHSLEDIRKAKMKPFVAYGGKAGCLVNDHGDGRVEATALFNAGGPKGAGLDVLRAVVEHHGVNYVECFGPILQNMYANAGFVVTDTFDFDPDQAPDGWDYDQFDHPQYHLMTLGGANVAKSPYWTAEQVDAMWQQALEAARQEATEDELRVWDNLVAQAESQS